MVCLCACLVLMSHVRPTEASGREEGAVESLREPEPGFQQHPLASGPIPSLSWSSRWETSSLGPVPCCCCRPHLGTLPFRHGRAASRGCATCLHSHWQMRINSTFSHHMGFL